MRFSNSKRWLLGAVCAAGLLTAAAMTVRAGDGGKDKEKTEVKMKFDDAPAAVKTTITREAEGAVVNTVDKETKKDKTIYEADAKIGKHNYEIKVMDDGTLISKKLDDEGEDDKDKD